MFNFVSLDFSCCYEQKESIYFRTFSPEKKMHNSSNLEMVDWFIQRFSDLCVFTYLAITMLVLVVDETQGKKTIKMSRTKNYRIFVNRYKVFFPVWTNNCFSYGANVFTCNYIICLSMFMRGNFFQEAPTHNLGNFTICKFKKFDFSRRGERGPGPP